LVSLDVLDVGIGAQHEIEWLPLLGISADPSRREGTTITISIARPTGDHVTHVMHGATSLQIERTAEGAVVAVQVESADKARAILRFRSVTLPETVDGIPGRP
jgi:hypothetical protein